MTGQRNAHTNQQHRSETPKMSGILQRAAVCSVPAIEVEPKRDTESQAFNNLLLHKNFSQVPISATKPPQQLSQHPGTETPSASVSARLIQAKGEMKGNRQDASEEQRPYHTDLPADLKSGIESLSGISMDNVNVHYNSSQPAQLNALAYAQGSDIHVAPGQEQHLPHEAWHLVQQAQGRVKPTMQLRDGVPVNDDEGLEHEADVMGAKALASGGRMTQGIGEGGQGEKMRLNFLASPVLQAVWLIDNFSNSFHWKPEPNAVDPPDPPNSLMHLTQKPLPEKYQIDGGSRHSGKLLLSLERYLREFPQRAGHGSREVYNPFGRFSSPKISSFIPSVKLDKAEQASLIKNLKAKDKSFREITAIPNGLQPTRSGYPSAVIVGKVTLYYIEDNDFGAIYAEDDNVPADAAADKQKVADITLLPKLPPSLGDVRLANNENLTADEIEAWSGRVRSVDQGVVMGASAGDAAQNAGFDKHEGAGWEWLHLIAHSMGGIAVHGPQVAANLVAGTSECNTQMIVVEEFLKEFVRKNRGRAALRVQAKLYDQHRHIGQTIVYDFEFYNEQNQAVAVYHWKFNALSRRRPVVMENRSLRAAAREDSKATTAATLHTPRSEPTSHSPAYAPGTSPFDMLIDDMVHRLSQEKPDQFVAALVQARNQNGGTLHSMVYQEIGENLTFDNVSKYVPLLHKNLSPNVAESVLYYFLFKQDYLDGLRALNESFIIPFYEKVGVPDAISNMVKWKLTSAPVIV